MTANRLTILAALVGLFLFAGAHGAAQMAHFHDKGKLPSKYTIEKQQQLRKTLPFADNTGFRGTDQRLYRRPGLQADYGRKRPCSLGYGQIRIPAER